MIPSWLFWYLVLNGLTTYMVIALMDHTTPDSDKDSHRVNMASNCFWVVVMAFLIGLPLLVFEMIKAALDKSPPS